MRKSSLVNKIETKSAVRRYRKVAAYAVLGLFIGVLLALRFVAISESNRPLSTEMVEQVKDEEVIEVSLPTKLRIPAVGIEASFETPLGVDENRVIEVPESYETVGYYKYGPRPGEIGPSVVLGHVDSFEGPAVLYSLGQVKEGERIEIEREDGSVAVFVVDKLERHEQDGFPTAKVYSDLDYAGLRLITCSGVYDHGSRRYSHNLIVFAHLVEEIPAQ